MNQVVLSPVEIAHSIKTFEWICDPDFREKFMVRGDVNWKTHLSYFENLINDPAQQAYAIYLDDSHVGNCGFKHMDFNSLTAEIWLYIGYEKSRGAGVASKALKDLITNKMQDFKLINVYVHVAEDNHYAKRLYIKNGFYECGEPSEEWQDRSIKMLRLERKRP